MTKMNILFKKFLPIEDFCYLLKIVVKSLDLDQVLHLSWN